LDQLDDLGDSGRTTNQYYFVDLILGHTTILQDLFDGGNTFLEVRETEFFELGSGDGGREIDGLGEGINFDLSLSGGGQDSLGSFALSSKSSHGSGVSSNIELMFLKELSSTVLN
jgi:hypothetical protein